MADDVVERLRDFMMLCSPRGGLVLQDVIAEIERLRAELGRRSPSPDALAARREAIEECAKVAEHRHRRWRMPHPDDARRGEVCDDISACADIAKAIRALSPPVEGE